MAGLATNPSMMRAQALRQQMAQRQQQAAMARMATLQQGPPRSIQQSPVRQVQQQQARARAAATPPADNRSGLGVDWGSVLKGSSGGGGGGGGGNWLDSLKDLGGQAAQVPLKFLETVDVGRRAVLSTAQELGDLAEGKGNASWSDFTSQIKDPSFGFGDVVGDITGNEWLDRTIGFLGDVVADPLTYVAPGAHEFTGLLGRSALADLGVKAGLTEARISEIARLGESALTRGERAGLGLDRAGYRFAGKRIPGTEKLVEGVAPLTAKARARLGGSALGSAWQRFRSPEGMEPFLERLARGEGGMSAITATNQVAAHQAAKGAVNNFTGRFGQDVRRVARKLGGRTDLTHELETGASTAEARKLESITKQMFSEASTDGGVSALKLRSNYVPHYNMPEFEEFLGRAKEAGQLKARTGAEPEGSSRLLERVFEPNSDITVNGVDIHLDSASIDDITTKFHAAFPDELGGRKLIEDDPAVWMSRLLEDHAADVGQVAWEKRLRVGGSLVDEADVITQVPDKEATKEARDRFIGRAQADIKGRRAQMADLRKQVREAVQGATKTAKTDAKAGLEREQTRLRVANEYMGRVTGDEAKLRAGAERTAQTTARDMERQNAEMVKLVNQLDRADAKVTGLLKQWHQGKGDTLRGAYQAAIDERQALVEQIKTGLEATKVQGQIATPSGEAIVPERTFVGQAEGPPTAVTPGAAATVAGGEQGLLERTMGRQGAYEQAVTQAGPGELDDEFTRKLASLGEGREVQPLSDAEATVQRLEKAKGASRSTKVQAAIGRDAEVGRAKKGFPYGETERKAAKRELAPTDLTKPDLFSPEVLGSMPPDVQEAWAAGQAELDAMFRPYRTEEAQAARQATEGLEVTEAVAGAALGQRRPVEAQIELLDRELSKMQVGTELYRAPSGGSRVRQLRDTPRYKQLSKQRDELYRQLRQMKKEAPISAEAVVNAPLTAAMVNNPEMRLAVEGMNDMAEFIARYRHGLSGGGATGEPLQRAVVEEVLTNRATRLEAQLRDMREATGRYRYVSGRGAKVPRFTEEEIAERLEREWNQHVNSVKGNIKAQTEANRLAEQSAALPPLPPAPVKPRRASPEQLAQWERDAARHDAIVKARAAEERQLDNRLNQVQKVSVPKGTKSKAQFFAERRKVYDRQTRVAPTKPEAASVDAADRAMAGEFAGILQPLMEDVTAARQAKNKLDASARKAGHRLRPPGPIEGEDPLLAGFSATEGAPMKLEDWQAQMAASTAPAKRAVTSEGQQKARARLAADIGLAPEDADEAFQATGRVFTGEGDLTGIRLDRALTDLRTQSRRQVNEVEREVMGTIERLTGVKWDTPRAALTTYKGKGTFKYLLDGKDINSEQMRMYLLAKGVPEDVLGPTKSIDRMLKKYAAHLHPDAAQDWDTATFNQLTQALGLNDGKSMLQHTKINRALSPQEQMAVYLEGQANDAYRYIDSGQSGAIHDLYKKLDVDAKSRLFTHIDDRRLLTERVATDTNIRLSRIDAPGGGAEVTHDPMAMLTGRRDAGVLLPPSAAEVGRPGVIAETILPAAREAAGAQLGQEEFMQAARRQAVGGVEAQELAPIQARHAAEQAQVNANPELFGHWEQPQLEQALRQQAEEAAVQPGIDELRQAVEAATGPRVRAAKKVSKAVGATQPARPRPGSVDLSDIGGTAARDTARADIAAIEQATAAQQANLEQFRSGRLANLQAGQTADVAATRRTTEGALAAGETRAAYDAERLAALQAQFEELGGQQAITQGQQARQAYEGQSVRGRQRELAQEATEPLHQDFAQAEAVQREATRAVETHRQAMEALSDKQRADLQGYSDSLNILSGHADAAVQHTYNAEALVAEAKQNVEAIAKDAPERVKNATVDDYSDWVTSTQKWLGADIPQDAKDLLQSSIDQLVKDGPKIDRKIAGGQQFIKDARAGKVIEVTKDQIMSGWKAYKSKVTGESLAIDSELDRTIRNLATAFEDPGKVWGAVDSYTKFFKTYATATPGFHIRNAMSASFMNFSDGVSARNQVDGAKVWTAHFRNPSGQWWNDASIPARYRGQTAKDVVAAVYNSGAGGQFSAAEIGERAFAKGSKSKAGKLLMDNLWVRGSKRSGEYVEGAVRSGMALDSLARPGYAGRSGTIEGATQRINRIHFNYSQASKVDAKIRRVVPFWTFLSRNVPLQMQQMVLNPRSYAHYQSFVRNFQDPNSDNSDLPEWMRQNSAFRVTPTMALMPDIGATQLQANLNTLTSPMKLASMLGPQFKAPAQLLTGKNFFYGSDYGDDDFKELKGPMSVLTPFMEALGQTEDMPGGGTAIPAVQFDALKDLLPFLGTTDRLSGDNQAQGVRTFLGIPARDVTQDDLDKERKRKQGAPKREAAADAARRKALAKLARAG